MYTLFFLTVDKFYKTSGKHLKIIVV